MKFAEKIKFSGIAVATMVATAVPAAADEVRDAQWPIASFRAPTRVWTKSAGANILVAVIDSGTRITHQDLRGQILSGRDFVAQPPAVVERDYDPHGHGTAMASLIVGRGHGQKSINGIIGLSPAAKVLPVATSTGSTGEAQVSDGIRYAVDSGAEVVNMSLSFPTDSRDLRSAVQYAESRNAVLVAGAGNDSARLLNWPAAYPGVVSVGAVDVDGKPWVDSNYGPGLTLTAPGVNIVAAGANSDSEYRLSDGTSDAAAYVSAEAALIRAEYPGLTAGQVVNRMIKSAVNPTGRVHDDHYGYGIIRPDAALTFDIPPGPPEGPLKQASAAASAPPTAEAVGAAPAAASTRQGGDGGMKAAEVVGGVAVAGAGGVWWMWWRRRKRVE